ncbi:Fe-S cluster assembly protein SufD [Kiloniella antarctica]|uniref:Fe-S cluster assembly protein SufD n=1 Tax=Kiloniella antarctica TaxID=1550907 RepID=A0ABW5BM60_9PROT
MVTLASDKEAFIAQYVQSKDHLPGSDIAWLSDLRAKNIALFDEVGLPSGKTELWKFTNLNPLKKQTFSTPALKENISANSNELPRLLEEGSCYRLVFIDGHYSADLSDDKLPTGVSLKSLSNVISTGAAGLEASIIPRERAEEQPLVALNTALMSDGYILNIADNVSIDHPIEILHLGGGKAEQSYHNRNVISVGFGSKVTIVENVTDRSENVYFSNSATEVSVGENATLHHYRVQASNKAAFLVSSTEAVVGKGASYDSFLLNTGARLSRTETNVSLVAENSSCHLNGVYMGTGDQHCDITTRVDHKSPHTTCDEVIKGILGGKARGVFQGKIIVHELAQKTVGNQSHRAMLLSDRAEVDVKPELEIFADDVICSHGCTSGQIDKEQLFYLRSRGLSTDQAQALLVNAFLADAVEAVQNDSLKDLFLVKIADWLEQNPN